MAIDSPLGVGVFCCCFCCVFTKPWPLGVCFWCVCAFLCIFGALVCVCGMCFLPK